MKRVTIVLLGMFLCGQVSAQPGFGKAVLIDDGWRFKLDSIGNFSAKDFDDLSWREVNLPHDWSIEGKMSPDLASCTGYLPGGTGWYRKHFTVARAEAGRKQFIYFDGVYCNSEVWINGNLLGKRPNGFISFMYDMTPYIKYGEDNLIAVRVDHSKYADSRWYTGSGISRDVFLVSSAPIHIDKWGIFAYSRNVTAKNAEVVIAAEIRNETGNDAKIAVENTLFLRVSGTKVAFAKSELTVKAGQSAGATQILSVNSPKIWDMESPNLYEISTVVSSAGKPLDSSVTVTGIRDIRFSADKGLTLNGKNIKVKGVCLHHDAGALGAAVPENVWRRRLLTLKELGCNSIRMSHNPQAYQVYNLCDELGFLVMDEAYDEWEFPKRKWIEGWNVGKNPGYDGTSAFFEEWSDRDITDFVKRDRNHPCIYLWSIGNEVDYPNDPYSHPVLDTAKFHQKTILGYKRDKPNAERIGLIARRLYDRVKAVDTTRRVTGAMAGVIMSNYTDYPRVIDVAGYNYTEERYGIDHATYPERVIYGSENTHEYDRWRAVTDNEHIFGQYLWTGTDYLGEAGKYPSRGFATGLIDMAGFIKTNGYYRRSLWSDKPTARLATIPAANVKGNTKLFSSALPTWNYGSAGQLIRVVGFTNCETATLSLNGREITAKPERDAQSNALCWDIPYEKGRLKLTGFNNGRKAAEHTLQTYGEASGMVATAESKTLKSKNPAIIELFVRDAAGVDVLDFSQPVKCSVRGAYGFIRLENGDMNDVRDFTSNEIKPFNGRLVAYIFPAGKGDMEIAFSSAGLQTVTLTVGVEQ